MKIRKRLSRVTQIYIYKYCIIILLLVIIISLPQEVGILFSCATGSGRTTFAMIICSIIVSMIYPSHINNVLGNVLVGDVQHNEIRKKKSMKK
jgi:hypothetical protein